MDDLLVQRFKSGDPAALTAMRNQLRAMAARVLSAPQWDLDATRRQTLERESAGEAMDASSKDAVQYVVGAMLAAGKRGISWLRKRDGLKEDEHPDRAVVVGVALQTASANQKLQLEEHFKECKSCQVHFDIAQEAIRGAANAQKAAAAAAPAPAPAPEQDLAEYARQRARQGQPAKAPHKKSSASQAAAERKKKAAARRRKRMPAGGSFLPLVVLGVLLAAGILWKQQPTEEQRVWLVASLLPVELPPAGRADQYEGTVRTAILTASQDGECRSAGNKLHIASKSAPDDLWLRYYEGMAFVCARDGRRAVEALEAVDAATTDLPWGFTWWLGQAYLLDLQTEQGLSVLDGLANSKHRRAEDARQLAARVRNTL